MLTVRDAEKKLSTRACADHLYDVFFKALPRQPGCRDRYVRLAQGSIREAVWGYMHGALGFHYRGGAYHDKQKLYEIEGLPAPAVEAMADRLYQRTVPILLKRVRGGGRPA